MTAAEARDPNPEPGIRTPERRVAAREPTTVGFPVNAPHARHMTPSGVAPMMTDAHYKCVHCSHELHYRTTKHNGCPDCGSVPLHGAD